MAMRVRRSRGCFSAEKMFFTYTPTPVPQPPPEFPSRILGLTEGGGVVAKFEKVALSQLVVPASFVLYCSGPDLFLLGPIVGNYSRWMLNVVDVGQMDGATE